MRTNIINASILARVYQLANSLPEVDEMVLEGLTTNEIHCLDRSAIQIPALQ